MNQVRRTSLFLSPVRRSGTVSQSPSDRRRLLRVLNATTRHISLTLHLLNFYHWLFILNLVMPSRSGCIVRRALNYHYLYTYTEKLKSNNDYVFKNLLKCETWDNSCIDIKDSVRKTNGNFSWFSIIWKIKEISIDKLQEHLRGAY